MERVDGRHEQGSLCARAKLVRIDVYGEQGIAAIAEILRVKPEVWASFEAGGEVAGHVLLKFIDATGVNPIWLFSAQGERYGPNGPKGRAARPARAMPLRAPQALPRQTG